jgi:hypothetical protein
MTSLAAAIPATDARPTWRRSVQSIEAALAAPEEIIVVDIPHRAARQRHATRDTGGGLGLRRLRRRGAQRRARADPEGLRVGRAARGNLRLYDDDPGGGGLVSDFRNPLHHHVHQGAAGAATTFWAGMGAIRRDVFLAEGSFDDTRFPEPSVEDIELGMRLAAHGHKLVLNPTIQGST